MAHKEAKIKQMEIETNLHVGPLFCIQLANLIPNLLRKITCTPFFLISQQISLSSSSSIVTFILNHYCDSKFRFGTKPRSMFPCTQTWRSNNYFTSILVTIPYLFVDTPPTFAIRNNSSKITLLLVTPSPSIYTYKIVKKIHNNNVAAT
jgi:hypothetical protein